MAASDYTLSGEGSFCPTGTLGAGIGPLTASINVSGFRGVSEADLEVGMAVLIDDEILRLQSIELPNLVVLRGCADTIPAPHALGAQVWFFSEAAATDEREYLATEVIGIKLMPFTVASGPMPIEHAPPLSLTFNWRAFRPYPPANFIVGIEPWYEGPFEMGPSDTGLMLNWHHRDRVGQADLLIGHGDASFGPEEGVTYRAKVYDADDTLVRTVNGITGTSWEYLKTMRNVDIPTGVGRIIFCSVRDGFESLQQYRIDVVGGSSGGGSGSGLGDTLGENLGGDPDGGSGGGLGDTLGENLGG